MSDDLYARVSFDFAVRSGIQALLDRDKNAHLSLAELGENGLLPIGKQIDRAPGPAKLGKRIKEHEYILS